MKRVVSFFLAVLFSLSSIAPAFATTTPDDVVVAFTMDDFSWLEKEGIGGFYFENGEVVYYDLEGVRIGGKTRGVITLSATAIAAAMALSCLGITFAKNVDMSDMSNAISDFFVSVPKAFELVSDFVKEHPFQGIAMAFNKRFLGKFFELAKDYFDFKTPAIEGTLESDKPTVGGSQQSGAGINLRKRPVGMSYSSVKHERFKKIGNKEFKVLEVDIDAIFSAGKFIGYKANSMEYVLDSMGLVIEKIPSSGNVFVNKDSPYPVQPQFYILQGSSAYLAFLNDNYILNNGSTYLIRIPEVNLNPQDYTNVYRINTVSVPYNSSAVTGGAGTAVTPEDIIDAWGTVAGGDDALLELPARPDGLYFPQLNTLPKAILDALAAITNPPANPDIDNPDKPLVPPAGFFPDILQGVKDLFKGIADLPKLIVDGIKGFFDVLWNWLSNILEAIIGFFDNFFVKLGDLLKFLFVPDPNDPKFIALFKELRETFEDRFLFIQQFKNAFENFSRENGILAINADLGQFGKFSVDFGWFDPYRVKIRAGLATLFYVMCALSCFNLVSSAFGLGIGRSSTIKGNISDFYNSTPRLGKGE